MEKVIIEIVIVIIAGFVLIKLAESWADVETFATEYRLAFDDADVILTYDEMSKMLREHFNDFSLREEFSHSRGFAFRSFFNEVTGQHISLDTLENFEKTIAEYNELREKYKNEEKQAEKEKLFDAYKRM